MIKDCPKCGRSLPVDNFGRARRRKGGLSCWCKECNRVSVAKCRATEEGRLRHLEREKARHRADPEPGRRRAKEWHAENIERAHKTNRAAERKRRLSPDYRAKETARQREWTRANPHKASAKAGRRRAAQIGATPKWLSPEHLAQIEATHAEAALLSRLTGIKHHVDHIVPLRGENFSGLHVPWNLRAIPASENCAKANKLPPETDFIACGGL